MKSHRSARGYYALRWEILERDNFTCQYCGQQAPNVKLEVDHKIAVADGGATERENLVTCCYACNRGKSGLSIIRKRKNNATQYLYGSSIPSDSDPWRRNSALAYIRTHPNCTAGELAQGLDILREYARVLCWRLAKRKLIDKKGNGKGWFVID